MKMLPNQTASESARDKANSTLTIEESQHWSALEAEDREFLLILGDVAGRYIAAHLHQRSSAPINASHRVAL